MAVYQCEKCLEPICKRDAKFCTSCGREISNPIPPKFLNDGKKKVWNVGLIAFCCIAEKADLRDTGSVKETNL
ncbi:hypothetical protein COR52_19575 [Vibrio mediterranei]|nr:hypothetical protein COR52_19575 [Vibrio mediterranei]